MKLSKKDFLNSPEKAITLMGMSGAGKTCISCKLEKWGWYNYSCDYEIGEKYLKEQLVSFSGGKMNVTVEDISLLSAYIGKLGDTDRGGLDFDLFLKRQRVYYDAEVSSLKAIGGAIVASDKALFVNDSTGSLCEIEDEGVIHEVGKRTLFVYLKIDKDAEGMLLRRAYECPKPLFYPKKFLEQWIREYLEENNLDAISRINPDDFARWVFPLLLAARKPKYQRLADMYGITIPAEKFYNLNSSDEFINIIADHLEDSALVAYA